MKCTKHHLTVCSLSFNELWIAYTKCSRVTANEKEYVGKIAKPELGCIFFSFIQTKNKIGLNVLLSATARAVVCVSNVVCICQIFFTDWILMSKPKIHSCWFSFHSIYLLLRKTFLFRFKCVITVLCRPCIYILIGSNGSPSHFPFTNLAF